MDAARWLAKTRSIPPYGKPVARMSVKKHACRKVRMQFAFVPDAIHLVSAALCGTDGTSEELAAVKWPQTHRTKRYYERRPMPDGNGTKGF